MMSLIVSYGSVHLKGVDLPVIDQLGRDDLISLGPIAENANDRCSECV